MPTPLELAGPGETEVAHLGGAEDRWVCFNYDSGAAIAAFPESFAPEGGRGNGQNYKTASGELLQDQGAVRISAYDERGRARGLTGRVMKVHKPLISASQVAKKQCSWLSEGGGWLIPRDSPVCKKVEDLLNKEATKNNNQMLPIYEERGVYNVYLKVDAKGSVAPLEGAAPEAMSKEELVTALRRLQGKHGQPRA